MGAAIETQQETAHRPEWTAWLLLALGVVSVSVSAILIRYATGADALAISFWRCLGGTLVLAPFARFKPGGIPRPAFRASVLAGMFLALHFATWITSVNLTSIASSVLLVSTSPVFTAVGAWLVFHERLRGSIWAGIALTMVGAALISGGEFGGSNALGNLLALIGGATAGFYLLAGQRARRDLGIVEYAVITYAVAGLILLAVCLVEGVALWGYPAQTWWAIAGMIVGPQLLGHTVINLVLKDIDATTIAVAIMAEPVLASALAAVLFSETPSALVYPGGALILAGIYLVTSGRREPVASVE